MKTNKLIIGLSIIFSLLLLIIGFYKIISYFQYPDGVYAYDVMLALGFTLYGMYLFLACFQEYLEEKNGREYKNKV